MVRKRIPDISGCVFSITSSKKDEYPLNKIMLDNKQLLGRQVAC